MKCVACGAAMRLMQVQNRHRHGVELSATSSGARPRPQSAQRLMFNRARMSGINRSCRSDADRRRRPSSFRPRRAAGLSGWMRADREARQQADGSQGTKGSGTDFGPAVRGQDTPITSTPIALRVTPAPAAALASSSPAWTNAAEKLGSRQTASSSEQQRPMWAGQCAQPMRSAA